MKAFTLFNLKSNITIEAYRKWSLDQVHPRDFEVVGAMDGKKPPYQLVEEIVITNPQEFERDNGIGDGAKLAEEWQSRVSDFLVIYCEEITGDGTG